MIAFVKWPVRDEVEEEEGSRFLDIWGEGGATAVCVILVAIGVAYGGISTQESRLAIIDTLNTIIDNW
jgi:hypothetical protein